MSENVERDPNAPVESGQSEPVETDVNPEQSADGEPSFPDGRTVEQRDADEAEYDGDLEANGLPDQVLIESSAKLAHEDQVPTTLREAEEAETRDGHDLEAGKTARQLRDERAEAAEAEADETASEEE